MGVYTNTPPTFLAGELPDAAKLTEITNFMVAVTDVWTSYTVTWSSTVTQPVLGNGTTVGRYRRLGKTVDVQILLTIGSTSTFGSAAYYFNLPVAAVRESIGLVSVFDSSAGTSLIGHGVISALGGAPGLGFILPIQTATNAGMGPTTPVTFATNDIIKLCATYEAA